MWVKCYLEKYPIGFNWTWHSNSAVFLLPCSKNPVNQAWPKLLEVCAISYLSFWTKWQRPSDRLFDCTWTYFPTEHSFARQKSVRRDKNVMNKLPHSRVLYAPIIQDHLPLFPIYFPTPLQSRLQTHTWHIRTERHRIGMLAPVLGSAVLKLSRWELSATRCSTEYTPLLSYHIFPREG
jgi:hypothetical protein